MSTEGRSKDPDGRVLLRIAREAIAASFGAPAPAIPDDGWLHVPAATFVTLTRHGALHGCIGTIEPTRSLAESVRRNAVAAAFFDTRSRALREDELAEVRVEVSVLGPLSPIDAATEDEAIAALRPHEDGVVLAWHGHRGVFLPQVWEKLPDRREFLAHLKLKAGLDTHFWASDVHLERFRVDKWREAGAPED